MIDEALVGRLYRLANGERWRLSSSQFAEALAASAARAFAGRAQPDSRELERYFATLRLDDLALACACAAGSEEAWEHFVREQRPALYRAADALDPGGGARDLADSLYADLYGLGSREGQRQSLFRYFHGRSRLTTWLRAVLAQRHVDRLRSERRLDALPDDESPAALPALPRVVDPDRDRYVAATREAFDRAVSALPARDRLRLGCYYVEELTLAETGRLLGEHEATVSRQLARTRKAIRAEVERGLREDAGLANAEIAQCFEYVTEDVGPIDLADLLGVGSARKKPAGDRSYREKTP